MLTLIAVTALRRQELFATPNGSIYETLRGSTDGGPVPARLWWMRSMSSRGPSC